MLRLPPIALLLAACSQGAAPPDRARTDPQHLQQALTSDDHKQGREHCLSIAHHPTRDDCLTALAERTAGQGHPVAASELCQAVKSRLWKSECRFMVVDVQGLVGSAGAKACEATGRYRARCMGHVAVRTAVADASLPSEVGSEVAWAHAARPLLADYVQAHRVDEVLDSALGALLAHRFEPAGIDPALCGSAPAQACSRAVNDTVQRDYERLSAATVCAAAASDAGLVEQAARLGATPWKPSVHAQVRQAWIDQCSR